MEGGSLFVPPVGAHAIPWWRAFEIDEPADIPLAEVLCRTFCEAGQVQPPMGEA
jgi:hypothetical protein